MYIRKVAYLVNIIRKENTISNTRLGITNCYQMSSIFNQPFNNIYLVVIYSYDLIRQKVLIMKQ